MRNYRYVLNPPWRDSSRARTSRRPYHTLFLASSFGHSHKPRARTSRRPYHTLFLASSFGHPHNRRARTSHRPYHTRVYRNMVGATACPRPGVLLTLGHLLTTREPSSWYNYALNLPYLLLPCNSRSLSISPIRGTSTTCITSAAGTSSCEANWRCFSACRYAATRPCTGISLVNRLDG